MRNYLVRLQDTLDDKSEFVVMVEGKELELLTTNHEERYVILEAILIQNFINNYQDLCKPDNRLELGNNSEKEDK